MKRDEAGLAAILTCLMVSAIVGMVVLLVVDAWRIIAADRSLSAAVDAAAAAGANAVDEAAYRDSGAVVLDPGRAESLASDSLSSQPDAFTYVNPSVSASPERVTVEAERTVRLFLLKIIGEDARTVRATAEATPRRSET